MRVFLTDLPVECRRELVGLLEHATTVGTWDWNIAENTLLWSPRQFTHFGLNPLPIGSIDYEIWLNAIHPDDRAMVQTALAHTIASGDPLDLTFRVLWRDSEHASVDVHWLRSQGRLVRDLDGLPLRMVGTSRDITQAETTRALECQPREMTEAAGVSRFDIYFDSSPDCLVQFKVESDGRFVYQAINPAGLAAVGIPMAAARGLTPIEVMGSEAGRKAIAALETVAQTGLPYRYEPTFAYADASVTYDAMYLPMFDKEGRVTGVLCRARDITSQKQMERALHQAEKMEALGQMAAGISHDFNNFLSAMQGCFIRLKRLGISDEGARVIDMGCQALVQGQSLTRQLLTFSRQQEVSVQAVDVNSCVESFLSLLRSTIAHVDFVTMLSPASCVALADQGLLEACLMNLCMNARDAATGPCRIEIETVLVVGQEPPCADLEPEPYVAVTVRDNGTRQRDGARSEHGLPHRPKPGRRCHDCERGWTGNVGDDFPAAAWVISREQPLKPFSAIVNHHPFFGTVVYHGLKLEIPDVTSRRWN